MPLRKSLLLASIAAFSVTVATAQTAGQGATAFASADRAGDPFAAPSPGSAGSPAGPLSAADLDAVFGAPAPAAATPPSGDAFGAPAPAASPGAFPAPVPMPMPVPVAVTAPAANPFAIPAPAPAAAATRPANPFAAPPAPAPAPASKAEPFSPGEAAPGAAAPAEASVIDESALRYYASQRDLVRVGAEIRRLKSLYSGWQPPRDLFAPTGTVNEQALWDLYGKGAYGEVRQGIERLRKETPTYVPSAELAEKLDDGEARAAIQTAATAGNWPAVIAAAQARPSLLVCPNMDVLWNVGEGFARVGNMARSYDLYAYVLGHCEVPAERLATFQKASALLPAQGVSALLAFGRPAADGRGEFDSVRFDGLRKRIADAGTDGVALPVSDEMKAYADYVRAARSAPDMAQIGWYFYGLRDWQRSAEWFRAGMEAGGDAKTTEGYLLSLRNAGSAEEAERIGYRAYKQSPELTKIYVEMVAEELTSETPQTTIAPDLVTRFERVVTETKSPLGAQALGWHLIAADDAEAAQPWFQRSVDWKPTEEGVVGLAVAATRLKQVAEVKRIRATYEADFPALADFKEAAAAHPEAAKAAASTSRRKHEPARTAGRRSGGGDGGAMAEANRLFKAGDYEGTLAALDRSESRRGKEYGAEILRGWANHKLKRWDKAREIFTAQDKIRSTRDTRFGIGATSNSQHRMWSETDNKCNVWGKC